MPPHWAELVSLSADIPINTEKQVGTWQLIPDIEAEDGDFSSQTKLLTTFDQAQEGVKHRVTFADNCVQNDTKIIHESTKNTWPMPMPINLDSSGLCCSSRTLVLNRHNEVYSHVTQMIQENMLPAGLGLRLATPTLSTALDSPASFTLPVAFDPLASSTLPAALDRLESSTLSAALDPSASSSTPAALVPSAKPSNLSASFGLRSTSWKSSIDAFALFSSICSHGHGYSSLFQEKLSDVTHSTFSKAVDSYHCVNTLYDGTINCFLAVAQSSIALNETFTYTQAMKEKDFNDFALAMVHEVDDQEKRGHWTIIQHFDMPADSKTIMSILSYKRKRYPDGTLNKHKARLCAHGRCWVL